MGCAARLHATEMLRRARVADRDRAVGPAPRVRETTQRMRVSRATGELTSRGDTGVRTASDMGMRPLRQRRPVLPPIPVPMA
ncbi:hypothetical protein ABTE18_20355, partial [Acinetobacter baumannii]